MWMMNGSKNEQRQRGSYRSSAHPTRSRMTLLEPHIATVAKSDTKSREAGTTPTLSGDGIARSKWSRS